MPRVLLALLAALALAAAGCGGDSDKNASDSNASTTATSATSASAPGPGGCKQVAAPQPRKPPKEKEPKAALDAAKNYTLTFKTN